MKPIDSEPWMKLETVIGFGGSVVGGLKVHPDGKHLIYSVGNLVVIEHLETGAQEFLQETKEDVCDMKSTTIYSLALSKSGKYIAVGNKCKFNFVADVVVWDYEKRCVYGKYSIHKINVEMLAFSHDDLYLYSIGGVDDRMVAAYDMKERKVGCSMVAQPRTSGPALLLKTAHTTSNMCVTAGRENMRVWCMEEESMRLQCSDVRIKKILRTITSLEIDPNDEVAYAGTRSGDVIFVSLSSASHLTTFLTHQQLACGIIQLLHRPDAKGFVVGTGGGVVTFLTPNFIKIRKDMMVQGTVTSIVAADASHDQYFIGTSSGNIYRLSTSDSFKCLLFKTAHHQAVNDVAFPWSSSELLLSASGEEVRVWSLGKHREVSRMVVPNHTCTALQVMKNGKSIVTGWSDCRLRAFLPESGKPLYVVESTYGSKVTCLCTTEDCARVVSGSDLGHVVIWSVPTHFNSSNRSLMYVSKHVLLKGHRAPVTCVSVRTVQRLDEDTRKQEDVVEVLSCSLDGTLIIWDDRTQLARINVKTNCMMFNAALFHPTCPLQVISTGTGGVLSYYEVLEGSLLFQASDCGVRSDVTCMDVTPDGRYVVTGDSAMALKIWGHSDGEVLHREHTHTTEVVRVKVSNDSARLVSTGHDGSIYLWTFHPPPLSSLGTENKADGDKVLASQNNHTTPHAKTTPCDSNEFNHGKECKVLEC